MNSSWPNNEAIFHAARDISDPDRRREYVREACDGDEALRQLEAEDPRKAELVKLRFFAGLTAEQTSEANLRETLERVARLFEHSPE